MNAMQEMLSKQIIGLSWIRCCMEEGVSFINKVTNEVESNERVIFDSFEAQSGHFDLPMARVSPSGFEKNILEVVGSFILNGTSETVTQILVSQEFKAHLKDKIEQIRKKT